MNDTLRLKELQKLIRSVYRENRDAGGWRRVGELFGVTGGMAYRIAKGYEPKDPHIRYILRLPAMVPAPVCPKCGEIHLKMRCDKQRTFTRWDCLPVALVRWALDHREEL
jgi:hypothetical protein